VAGQNFILKRGDVLFREGDSSNGMYILRKGSIQVFLERGGKTTSLATVSAGSMLGEMALFDNKPRSASAVALEDTEVTLINNEDFAKILKQIPKWFVTLMSTLSTRLRETNSRLQAMQADQPKGSQGLSSLIELMQMLSLCFHKFGQKDGKQWTMNREDAEKTIYELLKVNKSDAAKMIDTIVNSAIISGGKDGYGKASLAIQNRGDLDRMIEFIEKLHTKDKNLVKLPADLEHLINMLNHISKESAYDIISLDWEEVLEKGKERALDTTNWASYKTLLQGLDESLEVKKNGNKEVVRIDKNKVPKLHQNFQIMFKLSA